MYEKYIQWCTINIKNNQTNFSTQRCTEDAATKPDGIYKSDSINLLFDPLEPDGSTFKSEINPRESPVCP